MCAHLRPVSTRAWLLAQSSSCGSHATDHSSRWGIDGYSKAGVWSGLTLAPECQEPHGPCLKATRTTRVVLQTAESSLNRVPLEYDDAVG